MKTGIHKKIPLQLKQIILELKYNQKSRLSVIFNKNICNLKDNSLIRL